MGVALFSFEDVGVDAPQGPVLRHVTTEIADRGVTVVVGPSGAGKSTLLRLCNRLEVPTTGTVHFRGDDVAGLDPLALRRRVGMVFQRPTPFGGTVRDNLRVADPAADDDRCSDALDRAALDRSFLDRPASELSAGEAQRACLARTLVTGPEVLLMDEPTSALDAGPRLVLERLAVDTAASGLPVVWVTHDLAQAGRVGTTALVVLDGTVRWAGPAGELRTAAAPQDVAAFVTRAEHAR